MNLNKLTQNLIEIGLSENESKVYIGMLGLGPTTILKIASKTNIKRSTIYSLIPSLIQKKLVTIVEYGWKKMYLADSPEKLEYMLEERKNLFQTFLPELTSIYSQSETESLTKYFNGLDEVKKAYDYILSKVLPGEDYLVIGAQDDWYNLDPIFFEDFISRRSKIDLNIRIIWSYSELALDFKSKQKKYGSLIKILPKGTVFNTNFVITKKNLLIHKLSAPTSAIIVENKGFMDTQRNLFEIVWGLI
ncbi:MAG: helix-turn-helix domain-containing protein [bacterium]